MATLYDTLVGDVTQPMMLAAGSMLEYPGSNLYNVFGPVYLPRIYGKDLSAFEIASSGKISITLQDTYAFDLDRNIATQTSFIKTIPGDSFQIQANANQVNLTLDATSNNLQLTASNNLMFTAQAIVYNIGGDSSSATGGSQFLYSDKETSVVAKGRLTVASLQDTVSISAADSNVWVILDSSACNLDMWALNNATLTAANSNVYINLVAATNDMTMFAMNDVNVMSYNDMKTIAMHDMLYSASNEFAAFAGTNASLSAATGSLVLNAAASNVSLTLDALTLDATLAATSNVFVSAVEGSLTATARSNVILHATNGPIHMYTPTAAVNMDFGITTTATGPLASTASTFEVTASNFGFVNALTGSLAFTAAASNTQLFLGSAGALLASHSNIATVTGADYSVSASNDIDFSALLGSIYLRDSSNASVALSNASLAINASSNVVVTSSNLFATVANAASLVAQTGSIGLAAQAKDVTVYALSNVAVTASNAIDLFASEKAWLQLDAVKYEARLFAASNILATASNGSILLDSDASKVTVRLDKPTDSLLTYALSNTTLVTGNDFSVTASNIASLSSKSNLNLSAAAGGATFSMGADNKFAAQGFDYTFGATNAVGYKFNIGACNLMTVQDDKVIVNGGLDVYGTINSIAIQNTELHINDRTVQLSYPLSNESVLDGTANTSSGMVVYGMPAAAASLDAALAAKVYAKSIEWNYGTAGVDAMLTSAGIATESFWEMKGGRFQLTSTKSNGKDISFGLRINEQDELEMIKIFVDGADVKQVKRIAKFGKTLM